MKRNGTLCILLIVNLLPSCDSGTSSHKLVIELPQPKEAAQAALQDIWIRSLIPQTSEATCADLNKNFYAPDDTRYRQESLDVMNAPFAGKISNLKPSWNDTQSRLIYVECFDANGGLILNGCSEVDNSKKEIELSLSIVCASNKADCDNDFSTGCETAITTVSNCGACRQGCTNDHGQTACPQGSCAPTCAEGFSDCDGNPDNGCETDLNSEAGCNGNGTCSFVNNASVCSCRLPYAGNHCEQCAADYHGIYPNCFQPSGDSCLVSECFLVAPTGQTACYNYGDITDCGSLGSPPNCINAYCGQDAQYAKSRTFTFTNDEVTDSATGLIWQRTASTSNGPWSQALNTCSGLWRLPNPIELHSIVDHGSYGYPMIDSEAFPSTPCSSPYDNDCLYWTSANDNNDPDNNAWAVRFNEDPTIASTSV